MLAEHALAARHKGDLDLAKRLFNKAFNKESSALNKIKDNFELEPTRSILHRSAASLALECGMFEEAEKLIFAGLIGYPPAEIYNELKELLQNIDFQRHLDLKGVELGSGELQMSMAGDDVGSGIASYSEFISRITNLEKLIYRTAARKAGEPFQEAGRRKSKIKDSVSFYLSVPRAASFAVTFRIGQSKAMKLPGTSFADDVIEDMLVNMEDFNNLKNEKIQSRIKDQLYYRNFVGLANEIAPDGEAIREVGFTSMQSGREKRVVLSTPRKSTQKIETEELREAKVEQVTVRGTLLFAKMRHIDDVKGQIQLVDAKNKKYRIMVPGGMMSDIVRPLWEYEVIVSGPKISGVIHLEDIEKVHD